MRVNQYLMAFGLLVLLAGCETVESPCCQTGAAPVEQAVAPKTTIAPKQSTGMIGIQGYQCGTDISLSKTMTCPQACSDRGIDASNSGNPPCMESGDCMLIVTGMNTCQCCVKK